MIAGRLIPSHPFARMISNDANTWSNVLQQSDTRIVKLLRRESKIMKKILKHTEISCDHMTPEIKLFLLTPNCPWYHAPIGNDASDIKRHFFLDPFWSIYWPGGQALTRFILDESEKLFPSSNKDEISVLDLGAGCGASAIAAKLVGAKKVLANDIDKAATVAISMNATLNNVDIETSEENLLHQLPQSHHDVILIGDMLYDEEIARILIPWLEYESTKGTRIYLGDPGRHGLTNDLQKRLKLLRRYSLPINVQRENHGYHEATVWQFLSVI